MKEMIYEIIDKNPGLNIREITEEVHVTRTAVTYHAQRLLNEGRIATLNKSRHRLHFTSSTHPVERQAFAAMRIRTVRNLLYRFYENPKYDAERLSAELGTTSRVIRRFVRMLARDGLAKVIQSEDTGTHIVDLHPLVRIIVGRLVLPDMVAPPDLPARRGVRGWLWFAGDLIRSAFTPW